jgi:hypothetical protein
MSAYEPLPHNLARELTRNGFFTWIPRNPLKSPNSVKGIQGNAGYFAWIFLGFICRELALRLYPSVPPAS